MVQNAKGKVPTLPKQINQSTGKVSTQLTGFNEVAWGKRCKSYMRSAKGLSSSRFDEVVSLATEFMKTTHHIIDDDIIEVDDDDNDIHTNIIDISSSSEDETECKSLHTPAMTPLTPHYLFRDAVYPSLETLCSVISCSLGLIPLHATHLYIVLTFRRTTSCLLHHWTPPFIFSDDGAPGLKLSAPCWPFI